jgi:hypothetical protein
MFKLAVLSLAALAIALPASADERGRGGHSSKKPAIDVDAKVKGLLDVDADILSKSRKGVSVLDLNATVGKLGVDADLDISRKKGVDLDVEIGKSKRSRGGHGNYDFDGGVGH